MKVQYSIRDFLPYFIRKRLFGDREKFGLIADVTDTCWIEWNQKAPEFYLATQRASLGKYINHSGYRVMSKLSLEGKHVLEIGAADLQHYQYWQGKPKKITVVDVHPQFLARCESVLKTLNIPYELILLENWQEKGLPFEAETFDVVLGFYCLEHLYPLKQYVEQLVRVLKPDGQFVGAIPSEGGLAWGMGRFLTSRRWLKRNTTIDPDKIICWEHPNYSDGVIATLDELFGERYLKFWPMSLPLIDVNLTLQYIYTKPKKRLS